MLIKILAAILGGAFVSEFFGYWLHILLHSNKIEFLSRNHMIHHLLLYGPEKPLRTDHYVDSVASRTSVLGIGLEWIIPLGVLIAVLAAAFYLAGVGAGYQLVFFAAAIAWGFFMFSYIHDAMHVRDFWMERNPLFKNWYLNARKRHDVHHLTLSDDGKMVVNFGICFFLFDRLFGSYQPRQFQFNRKGLDAAMSRYAFIFKAPRPSA
jgi:sterol desaturase/sphingolipid hydroxylase (fatty acid hydroxylase superfamily)